MRIKAHIWVLLVLALLAVPIAAQAEDDLAREREYKIKAAFLYNFIKFVDWPEGKAVNGDIITIGIIGKNPFGQAFEPVKDKKIKDRKLVVKQFPGLKQYKTKAEDKTKYKEEYCAKYKSALEKCHVLFISSSEKDYVKEITSLVKDSSVLTVSELKDFLNNKGVISLLMEEKKVRFRINVTAARQAKLKMRSQLLRLAKEVVEEKSLGDAKS